MVPLDLWLATITLEQPLLAYVAGNCTSQFRLCGGTAKLPWGTSDALTVSYFLPFSSRSKAKIFFSNTASPLSLMSLCRRVIRNSIKGDIKDKSNIDALTLPQPLKDYLHFWSTTKYFDSDNKCLCFFSTSARISKYHFELIFQEITMK